MYHRSTVLPHDKVRSHFLPQGSFGSPKEVEFCVYIGAFVGIQGNQNESDFET